MIVGVFDALDHMVLWIIDLDGLSPGYQGFLSAGWPGPFQPCCIVLA